MTANLPKLPALSSVSFILNIIHTKYILNIIDIRYIAVITGDLDMFCQITITLLSRNTASVFVGVYDTGSVLSVMSTIDKTATFIFHNALCFQAISWYSVKFYFIFFIFTLLFH